MTEENLSILVFLWSQFSLSLLISTFCGVEQKIELKPHDSCLSECLPHNSIKLM